MLSGACLPFSFFSFLAWPSPGWLEALVETEGGRGTWEKRECVYGCVCVLVAPARALVVCFLPILNKPDCSRHPNPLCTHTPWTHTHTQKPEHQAAVFG